MHMRSMMESETQEGQHHRFRSYRGFFWKKILLRTIPHILLRMLLPLIIYQVVGQFFPLADWMKICISASIPLSFFLLRWLRWRSIDLLSVLMLSGLGFSLLLALLTQDPNLLSLREAFLHGLFGLICLGSLAFPRPLAWTLYTYAMTGKISARGGRLEEAIQQELAMLSTFRLVTLVAGCVLLAVALVHVSIVFYFRDLLVNTAHRSLVNTFFGHGAVARDLSKFMISIGRHIIDIGADILLGLWAFHKLSRVHRRLCDKYPSLAQMRYKSSLPKKYRKNKE